ncbi:hypothetical protein D3C73_1452130 [compost metagenome]
MTCGNLQMDGAVSEVLPHQQRDNGREQHQPDRGIINHGIQDANCINMCGQIGNIAFAGENPVKDAQQRTADEEFIIL